MIFKLIRPKSLDNPDYENFEYLIRWMGRDGSEYLYMFYDAELNLMVSNEVVNEQDTLRLQSLISSVNRDITLAADDLSKNDIEIIAQIFENKYVTRLLKDNSVEIYAPSANSFKYRLTDGRYELSLKFTRANIKQWK